MTGNAQIGLVAALREEVAPLLGRIGIDERLPVRPGRFVAGRLGGRRVVAGWTGDGPRLAAAGLRALLASVPVDRLLFLGVGGGLSPGLAVGDRVLAERVVDVQGEAPAPDRAWLDRARRSHVARPGVLFTAEHILSTAEQKSRAWRELGSPPAAVADLETAVWTRIAGEAGVPYLAVRAVSDAAEESLPLDFERFRRPGGPVRRWRVIGYALARPALLPRLLALRQRVRLCAERLAELAEGGI